MECCAVIDNQKYETLLKVNFLVQLKSRCDSHANSSVALPFDRDNQRRKGGVVRDATAPSAGYNRALRPEAVNILKFKENQHRILSL